MGLEYSEGSEKANAAAGFKGVTSGNGKQQLEIMIAEINRTGGIAGRTVKPVFHVYDASSTQDTATQEQAACADFTQDNKVFAVIAGTTHSEVYLSCLAKSGVPFVAAPGLTISDESVLKRYPLYLELNTVNLSRQGELYGEALARTGYYDNGAKVGLLTFSQPNFQRAVNDHLEPALKRVGHPLTDKVEVAFPQSTADTGNFSAAVGSAVLRFRQKGITHVLMTDVNGLMTAVFLQAASNQKYYPRYGWLTQNGGQAIADLTPDKRTLQGAVQLGWFPAIDLNAANETVHAPGAKRCLDLFAAKGVKAASRNEEGIEEFQCDIFFYAQAAGARVATLTPQSFVQAYAAIGSAAQPATTYQVKFGANRDGAAAYRVQRWVDACQCFKADPGEASTG